MDIKLSKKELSVLEYLNSIDARSRMGNVSIDFLLGKTNLTKTTLSGILQKLISLSFVETTEYGYPDKTTGYQITTEGESYLNLRKELIEQQKQERIIWNFIVPIIVSFITAVLTSLIIN